jgi:hypothetical protein
MNDGVEAEEMNRTDTVVMQVSPVPQGWSVTKVEGTQCAKWLTNFKTKGDALSFAMFLAKTEPCAVVEIYDEAGLLDARSAYWTIENFSSRTGRL